HIHGDIAGAAVDRPAGRPGEPRPAAAGREAAEQTVAVTAAWIEREVGIGARADTDREGLIHALAIIDHAQDIVPVAADRDARVPCAVLEHGHALGDDIP